MPSDTVPNEAHPVSSDTVPNADLNSHYLVVRLNISIQASLFSISQYRHPFSQYLNTGIPFLNISIQASLFSISQYRHPFSQYLNTGIPFLNISIQASLFSISQYRHPFSQYFNLSSHNSALHMSYRQPLSSILSTLHHTTCIASTFHHTIGVSFLNISLGLSLWCQGAYDMSFNTALYHQKAKWELCWKTQRGYNKQHISLRTHKSSDLLLIFRLTLPLMKHIQCPLTLPLMKHTQCPLTLSLMKHTQCPINYCFVLKLVLRGILFCLVNISHSLHAQVMLINCAQVILINCG